MVQVAGCLGVHDDDLSTCFDPSAQHRVGIVDHELGFEFEIGMSAIGRDDVGPECRVRHESAVHHVPLDPIDASVL